MQKFTNNCKVLTILTSKNSRGNNNLYANYSREIAKSDNKMKCSHYKLFSNSKNLKSYTEKTYRNAYYKQIRR